MGEGSVGVCLMVRGLEGRIGQDRIEEEKQAELYEEGVDLNGLINVLIGFETLFCKLNSRRED